MSSPEGASLDIVVVNWNTGDYLRRCLQSIAAADVQTIRLGRVVVVDNHSSDASAEDLHVPGIPLTVILNRANVGFGAACNQGAAVGDADYVLFLNPDTELFADSLTTAVGFMASDNAAAVGIVGGQLVDPQGAPVDSASRFPTFRLVVGRMVALDRLLPRWFPALPLTPAETAGSRFVDQVIGAFLMIRRPLFAQLGGFDPRFFMYFEEVDLSLRLRRLGYRSYHLHEARVMHAERVSSDQVPSLRTFYALRSRSAFAHKHWPRWQARTLDVLTMTVEFFARLVDSLAGRRWAQARHVVHAFVLYGRHVAWKGP